MSGNVVSQKVFPTFVDWLTKWETKQKVKNPIEKSKKVWTRLVLTHNIDCKNGLSKEAYQIKK